MSVPAQQPVVSQQPVIFSKKEHQESEKQEAIAAALSSDIGFTISLEEPSKEKKKEKEATVSPKIETESTEVIPIFHEEEIDSPKQESKSAKEATVPPKVEQETKSVKEPALALPRKAETELRTVDCTKMTTKEFIFLGKGNGGKVYYIEYLDPKSNTWILCAYKRFWEKRYESIFTGEINEVRRWVQIGTQSVEGLCQLIAIVHSDPNGLAVYPYKIFDTIQKEEIVPKGISFMFEYCNGYNLTKYLNGYIYKDPKGKPFNIIQPSYPQAVEWFRSIFEGLAYIHSKNIIHGDICARNIMFQIFLKSSGEEVEPVIKIKLIDLGCAYSWVEDYQNRKSHPLKEILTHWPHFAPELEVKRGVDFPAFSTKSDIFSLGFVLAELLLGVQRETIYAAGGGKMNTYESIVSGELKPYLRAIKDKYPVLVDILLNCLNANPKDRLEAAEMVSVLKNIDVEKQMTLLLQHKMAIEKFQKQQQEEERRKDKCCIM